MNALPSLHLNKRLGFRLGMHRHSKCGEGWAVDRRGECWPIQERFRHGGGHSCFLAYTIAVAITAPGRKQTVVHEVPLDVVSAPPPMKAAQRSEVIELNTCFCIPSGRVDLVAQCTKNAYEGGETPAVDYGIRNESSRALSAVKIKIKRQVDLFQRRTRFPADATPSV